MVKYFNLILFLIGGEIEEIDVLQLRKRHRERKQ